MTREKFKEIEKENEYISNLLRSHEESVTKKLNVFWEPLQEQLKKHNFICCVHAHYHPCRISIFDSVKNGIHRATIESFKIIECSESFPDEIKQIIDEFLKEGAQ